MKVLAVVFLVIISSTVVESMFNMNSRSGPHSRSSSRSRSSMRSSSRSHSRSHPRPKISIVMKALNTIQEKTNNDLGAVKSYLRHGTALPQSLTNGDSSQSQGSYDYQQQQQQQQRRPQQRRSQQSRPQQPQQEEPSEENGWLFGKIE